MQYTELLQDCDFWCGLPVGTIAANSTLKALFTNLLNVEYAKTLGKLQILSGKDGAEDTNYEKQQFSLFDIDAGVNDYQFLTDAAGNTITDITGVLIKPNGGTEFEPVERLALSDTDALLIMSPNSTNTGTPTGFIEKNNTVFFNKLPDYSAEEGGKLFYRLVPSYFATTDTLKKPGFVEHYHSILSTGASRKWIAVNKSDQTNLLTVVTSENKELTTDLATYIRQKNPTRTRLTTRSESSR
jgi:hypothetical protein